MAGILTDHGTAWPVLAAQGTPRTIAPARRDTWTVAEDDTGDGWAPAFDGQRVPFTEGNSAAVTHGARSERRVAPLAEQIKRDLLGNDNTPPHLHEPVFAASIHAWARAEACCQLIWAWLAERDIMTGLTDLTTSTEEEERGKATTTTKTTTRHVSSVLDTLRRYESLASNLRSKLGLDPASAARLSRDLAARRYMDASATPLDAALAAIEKHRAITAAGKTSG
jgi:hypothetical protein